MTDTALNAARPHSALGYQTPADVALNLTTAVADPLHTIRVPRAGQPALAAVQAMPLIMIPGYLVPIFILLLLLQGQRARA